MRGTRLPLSRWYGRGLVVAVLTLVLGALAPELDAKTDARIYALRNGKKKIFGVSASAWTAQWWQWALSLPYPVSPFFDDTGAFLEVGQRGPVWFLAGRVQPGAVTRTATIPSGKALLVPPLCTEWDNVGADPLMTVEELHARAAEQMSVIVQGSMFLTVDGVPVPDVEKGRVVSDAFQYAFPEDNVGQHVGQGTTRGIYAPAVSDGYWVMLKPLPVGDHTIHFGGTVGSPYDFTLDITYELTVVDSNRP
jgi:hypothetical protein